MTPLRPSSPLSHVIATRARCPWSRFNTFPTAAAPPPAPSATCGGFSKVLTASTLLDIDGCGGVGRRSVRDACRAPHFHGGAGRVDGGHARHPRAGTAGVCDGRHARRSATERARGAHSVGGRNPRRRTRRPWFRCHLHRRAPAPHVAPG